jgi:CYTH domain-containing protein
MRNASELINPSAPAGKSQQYAKPERERRFLLREVPDGEITKSVAITDRYFSGTRVRLRQMSEKTGDTIRTCYKLTQKIPAPDGGPGLLSTLYLSEEEFVLFSGLPGRLLSKTRYSIPPFGVDVFAPPLAGLILAECEFNDDVTMSSFVPPDWIVAEVTCDSRFTGGQLAATDPENLTQLLWRFGVAPPGTDAVGKR